jgi:hypothetical protein
MEAELKDDIAAEPVEPTDVAPAEAPAAAEAEPSPSTERDALDDLLDAYDRSVGNGAAAGDADDLGDLLAPFNAEQDAADRAAEEQQRELAWRTEQQRIADESARSAIELARHNAHVAELEQTVGQLQQTIAAEQWRQHQQRSNEDFERLAASEQAKLDGLDVDENHVKRWLLAEAAQDSELQRAWEARYYQPPGPLERARIAADIQQWGEGQAKLALQLPARARQEAERNIHAEMRRMWETAFPDPATYRANASAYVRKALDRMHREARRPRVDPDATADRLAVVAAMKGASGKPAPERPPDLTRMTDGEFKRYTEQFF